MLQPWMVPSDLSPGDSKSRERDWTGLDLFAVESAEDPFFDVAFGALWAEFGAAHEVEEAPVLSRRLCWKGARTAGGFALYYRLFLFLVQGKIAAVRDHTAMVDTRSPRVIVHLSHSLVSPDWRRTGLAGWLRALPVQTARNCLAREGCPAGAPITLVGEMERPNPSDPANTVRLLAYEKAGYRVIPPALVDYHQPDFRNPREIDLDGGPRPIPMMLIVRRVGREHETSITGAEARDIASALYGMFGDTFRARDMAPLWTRLEGYPRPNATIPLLAPTKVTP